MPQSVPPVKTTTITGASASIAVGSSALVSIDIPFFNRSTVLGSVGGDTWARANDCRIHQFRVFSRNSSSTDFDVALHETEQTLGNDLDDFETLLVVEGNTDGRFDVQYDEPLIYRGDDGQVHVEIGNDAGNAGAFQVSLEVSPL